jgi:hypothetical protein
MEKRKKEQDQIESHMNYLLERFRYAKDEEGKLVVLKGVEEFKLNCIKSGYKGYFIEFFRRFFERFPSDKMKVYPIILRAMAETMERNNRFNPEILGSLLPSNFLKEFIGGRYAPENDIKD